MLNARQQYEAQGFLHMPGVFSAEDIATLKAETDRMLDERASDRTWSGAWQQTVFDAPVDAKHTLRTVGDVHRHSPVIQQAVEDPRVLAVIEALIGPCALVTAMLIVKPPETGQPFPLHQDSAYYAASNEVYCIACLHLDATTPENGPLRFLPGRHQAAIPHLRVGKAHLDPATYRMEDTVEVCADAGDLVCFSHHTPHGSHPNRSSQPRALVRMGYIPRAA